ncbi:heat-inducible transcriptional repressor HrcA [Granulicella cerasi]|uniref:Heat-inducible transcription repressor HrcA n=1 Tax=Granulicella cerasi TaxID=741063 RepID=A0ABW1Z8A5_9BACT|nr:heat-inducible transcriptional repressor HrcA [Granulicella cerasi]
MANEPTLTARQRDVLMAIVESYIATGEPVSSGSIARSSAIASAAASPATIRNEMAALVDAGLLEQPHTSAGRVPSASAFRMYVEALHRGSAANLPGPTRAELHSRIDSSFVGIAGGDALLERTSQVLAMLSSGVGLAIGAPPATDMLEHVHFSRLASKRVLAVLVTRGGMVRDRMLAVERDLTMSELEIASNFLNEHFRGWTLDAVRAELSRRVNRERSAYQQMLASAQELWSQALPAVEGTPLVFVEGVANLVGADEDRERLRAMLGALEAKERLVELLNAYVDSRQENVRVVFDLERTAPEMAGLVLIAAPARVGDSLATVGVLGSKRMHYESTMNAVGYIANLFDRVLDLGREDATGL